MHDKFITLYNLPQPIQKSPEWFALRYTLISMSDCASALDVNPYESVESFVYKKCNENFPFYDNIYVAHGKRFEQIGTMTCEHLYNTKITEFGCIKHVNNIKILACSPDGVSSKYTLDYMFNSRLGEMIEIKCPYSRPIVNTGGIDNIIPYYYFCQIQGQMECADLDICSFIQCAITEYSNRDEYLLDTEHEAKITEGDNATPIETDSKTHKGYILQFLKKVYVERYPNDTPEFQALFIYPPRLNMNQAQYDAWVINTLGNWRNDYPEHAETHYFDKIIYWKINNAHTITVERDREWFAKVLPVLKETWDRVLYYREHLDELPLLQEIADKRKAFYNYKTEFTVNNFEDNSNFMDDTIKNPIKKPFKKPTRKTFSKQSNDCDFVDD